MLLSQAIVSTLTSFCFSNHGCWFINLVGFLQFGGAFTGAVIEQQLNYEHMIVKQRLTGGFYFVIFACSSYANFFWPFPLPFATCGRLVVFLLSIKITVLSYPLYMAWLAHLYHNLGSSCFYYSFILFVVITLRIDPCQRHLLLSIEGCFFFQFDMYFM